LVPVRAGVIVCSYLGFFNETDVYRLVDEVLEDLAREIYFVSQFGLDVPGRC